MNGLVDRPGVFRPGGVGIFRGTEVIHVAPPAKRVPTLVDDLLQWLETTDEHPLVAGCLFHYEFEFIHPFPDGNGRLGRLWQTLILSCWKQVMAYVPVETVVRQRQDEYYQALARSDKEGDATQFALFILESLLSATQATITTDQVADQVTDQVRQLLKLLGKGEASASALMKDLALSHRPTFRENYLDPSLDSGFIERTHPESPRNPRQKYRLTALGKAVQEKR